MRTSIVWHKIIGFIGRRAIDGGGLVIAPSGANGRRTSFERVVESVLRVGSRVYNVVIKRAAIDDSSYTDVPSGARRR